MIADMAMQPWQCSRRADDREPPSAPPIPPARCQCGRSDHPRGVPGAAALLDGDDRPAVPADHGVGRHSGGGALSGLCLVHETAAAAADRGGFADDRGEPRRAVRPDRLAVAQPDREHPRVRAPAAGRRHSNSAAPHRGEKLAADRRPAVRAVAAGLDQSRGGDPANRPGAQAVRRHAVVVRRQLRDQHAELRDRGGAVGISVRARPGARRQGARGGAPCRCHARRRVHASDQRDDPQPGARRDRRLAAAVAA